MRSMRFPSWTVAFLLLTACAHRIDYGPTGPIEDPEAILDVLRQRSERVGTLRSEGRLGVDSPKGGGNLRMAIDVAKPGSVFLETADILGISRGTFSTDGSTFAFFDPRENVFYTGPATPELLGEFLPIALPPEEIVLLLLGQPPLPRGGEATLEVEPEGVYRIEVRQGGAVHRIRVGTRDLRLLSVETRGRASLDVSLSGHRPLLPDLPFPTEIDLSERRSRTKLRIRYSSPEVNGVVDPTVFSLEAPEGARVERLRD